ncbi:MAG: CDP-glycerol glycerophosphotransferase family protein, partial [Actinomycetes bacterium]
GLLGYFVSVRTVLFLAVGAAFNLRDVDARGSAWGGVAVGMLLTLCEPLIKTPLTATKQVVVNLPGVRPVPKPAVSAGWLPTTSFAALALGGVLAAAGAPGWVYLVAVLATVPLTVRVLVDAVRANLISRRAEQAIPGALARYAPQFAVYYAATQGVNYQLGMWLPYLERLGRPYVVITRQPSTVSAIRALTSAPILVPKSTNVSDSLDAMVVPSLRAAFYVQGSPQNQTFQRYRQMTHIWLNHGDSDKQANFHPRHATYDKLFVHGQQGVDRYAAHGIEVPPERFVIIGRPQVERIEVRAVPLPPNTARTVFYAPTWKGGRPSTNYSSLPLGLQLVEAVLARGWTVVFRPHPLSYHDKTDAGRIRAIHARLEADRASSGRNHVWGEQAEKAWDIPACFNVSDALITDVSSVASDFLASDKPFAMVAMTAEGDAFREEFPTARVAYVIERDLSTLPAALDAFAGLDPLLESRRAYRRYCIGDRIGPDAAADFLRITTDIIDGRAVTEAAPEVRPLAPQR